VPDRDRGPDLGRRGRGALRAGLIDGWLVDDQDKAAADDPATLAGIEVRALPLYMRDLPATAAIARAALDLALELRA
jgi:LPPG:FO 2-phospho-L-lactate transferase